MRTHLLSHSPQSRRQGAKLDLYRKFTNSLAISVLISIAWIAYEVRATVLCSHKDTLLHACAGLGLRLSVPTFENLDLIAIRSQPLSRPFACTCFCYFLKRTMECQSAMAEVHACLIALSCG